MADKPSIIATLYNDNNNTPNCWNVPAVGYQPLFPILNAQHPLQPFNHDGYDMTNYDERIISFGDIDELDSGTASAEPELNMIELHRSSIF
jgi:hypothetical protein